MSALTKYRKEVEEAAADNSVSFETVAALLALEEHHQNLHAYGARGRLRRAISAIVDQALQDPAAKA